jgi:tetratricopeptide (TPR) repeat protein/predicted Ser/Thr protein kinase
MDSAPLIGRTISHYQVTGLIGQGGMGVVYRAHDLRLERDVALKVLRAGALGDEAARKRFRAEALSLSRLNHPNIATIHDFDSEQGIDFVVMEFIAGEPLSDRVRTSSLPEKLAVAVGIQICWALEAAHEKGVIHRDLKPQNILLAAQGQVKVVDFGLAKVIQPGSDADLTLTMSDTDAQAGTLPYMAPEQLHGEATDARSDIWSAGAVLYEISTAQRPFPETRSTALIAAILNKDPIPPREVNPRISAGLNHIILKALDKDPARRYQSAREMRVDLERLAESGQKIPVAAPAKAPDLRRIAVWAAIAAVLIIGGWFGVRELVKNKQPLAHETILIGEISNKTGNQNFDETIAELLTTALEQSKLVSVFPPSRVADALREMKRQPPVTIDEAVGTEICSRKGLRAVVLGSVDSVGSGFSIIVRAVDPSDNVLVSATETITSPNGLSAAIDHLVQELRKGLGEDSASVKKDSTPLAQVTSSSLDAIRYFTLGKQKMYAGDAHNAIVFYQKALDFDQNFAMAMEGIGISYTNIGDSVRAEQFLKKAALQAGQPGQVNEIERQHILGNYAMIENDYAKACDNFQILTQLEPVDPAPFLSLGWCEGLSYKYEAAIADTQKAIDLLKNPRTQVNMAMLNFMKGDSQQAISITQDILKAAPNHLQAHFVLGKAQLLSDKLEDAQITFQSMVRAGGDAEVTGHEQLADMDLATGQSQEAKKELEAARIAARKQEIALVEAQAEIMLDGLSPGQVPAAESKLRSTEFLQLNPPLILEVGRMNAARHEHKEADAMAKLMGEVLHEQNTARNHSLDYLLHAELALAEGKTAEAIRAARGAVEYEDSPVAVETLARALEAAGQNEDAAAEYEKVLARAAQRSESYDAPAFHKVVEAHYRLGLLYQKLGKTDGARAELGKFLEYWKSADPELEIYKDATLRFRELPAAPAR